MLSRLRTVIVFIVHGILIISLLSITLKLLTDTKTEKEGIFKILFDQNISIRGLPNPIQPIQAQATDIAEAASGIAEQATSEVAQATKVVNDIESMATSAIAAGETLINGLIPKSCSVGTKYGCIEFNGRSDCVSFPMKKSDDVFDKLTDLSETAGSLEETLQHIPSLQAFLIIGLIFILVSTAVSYVSSLGFIFPLKSLINISLSGIALAAFGSFAGIVLIIYENGLALDKIVGGTLHRGSAYAASISMAVISSIHFVVVVVEAVMA